jgi:hypothetical protein
MRFSVQLLAIAATVLSFNATPRQSATPLPVSLIAPPAEASIPTVEEQAREVAAQDERSSPSPLAWVLAGGFLTLVVLRRTRGGPMG